MKIGIAQIDCLVGDVDANCSTMTEMIEEAAADRCDVVVLPEMADTGYNVEAIIAKASTWDDGPCSMLREVAARARIAVITGLSERVGERIYSSAVVIDKTGTIVGKYRKIHLFGVSPANEDRYLSPGDSLAVVELGGFKLGLMICYDLRFPELARALALSGAELIVISAAWPTPRIGHWTGLIQARAIENQTYVVAANRVGVDEPMIFGGNSCLIDPAGVSIACASGTEQTLVVGQINRDRINEVRSAMPVFNDRRPELYTSLTK
jgi:predicted amidohydrolase